MVEGPALREIDQLRITSIKIYQHPPLMVQSLFIGGGGSGNRGHEF